MSPRSRLSRRHLLATAAGTAPDIGMSTPYQIQEQAQMQQILDKYKAL